MTVLGAPAEGEPMAQVQETLGSQGTLFLPQGSFAKPSDNLRGLFPRESPPTNSPRTLRFPMVPAQEVLRRCEDWGSLPRS